MHVPINVRVQTETEKLVLAMADEEIVAAVCAVVCTEKRKKKRQWVRSWLARRGRLGMSVLQRELEVGPIFHNHSLLLHNPVLTQNILAVIHVVRAA